MERDSKRRNTEKRSGMNGEAWENGGSLPGWKKSSLRIQRSDAAPVRIIRYTLDLTHQYHNLLQKTGNGLISASGSVASDMVDYDRGEGISANEILGNATKNGIVGSIAGWFG